MEAAPFEGRSLDLCVGELVRVVAQSFLPLRQQPGRPQGETVGDRVRTRGEGAREDRVEARVGVRVRPPDQRLDVGFVADQCVGQLGPAE